ncbi:MAG: sigma-70 family RNA polymerase sigma factor [Acidobacteriota bacterium]
MKDSDEVLFLKYREGSMEAFEELLGRYESPLLRYLLSFTRNRQLAEDLFQETFARLVERKEYYTPEAPFKYYLYRVARNLAVDSARRLKVRRAVSIDETSENDTPMQIPSDDPSPERLAMTRELGSTLKRAIDELRDDQREVFLMREELGMTFEEIARMTGVPLPTVKSRMLYALRHLRKSLYGRYVGLKAVGEPCEAS